MTTESHHAERLLLALARFGDGVSRSMAEASDQPEFVANAPLLVLCALDLEGPQRPGMISLVVGLTSGGTTKLLDRMESAGLVHRAYGAVDGDHRGVLVEITVPGRVLLRSATEALIEHLPETKDLVKEIVALLEDVEKPQPS